MNKSRWLTSGMGLIEVLIGTSVLALSFLALGTLFQPILKQENQIDLISTLENISWNVSVLLQNKTAWYNTVNSNPTMKCLVANNCVNGPQGNFDVYDAANTIYYSGGQISSGVYGFALDSTSCTTYGTKGCVIQLTMSWSVLCSGTCTQPYQVTITPVFATSNLKNTYSVNVGRFNSTILENYP